MIRAVIALALVAVVAPAHAQPAAAKAHFKQARALQDSGEFARAAEEFKAAYELDHKPEMLFNIAQAYRLGGNKEAALDYYHRYLADQPTGAGAAEATQHVTELQKQLDDEHAAAKPPEPPKPVEPAKPEPRETPVQPSPPPPPRMERSTGLQIAGVVTLGVGAIALGAGIKLGTTARSAASDISQHTGPWTDVEQARFDEGQRANRNMIIAYVAGGALVTTGTVLVVMGRRVHVAPVVGANATGAILWGRF